MLLSDAYSTLAVIEENCGNINESNTALKKHLSLREELDSERHSKENHEAKVRLMIEAAELERQELIKKNSELERTLEMKHAELTTLALVVSQKNELIEKLTARLKTLSKSSEKRSQTKYKDILDEINILKDSNDEQWNHFQKQFESMDTEFRSRLIAQCQNLTPIELKICLLMRLNLGSKDIANILWSSPRTVETHRYSIRKKLHLPKDSNLTSYLSRI